MIRQWADKLLEILRRAVARITTLDEILLGAIFGLVLLMILNSLGVFN
jgi:tetrahydromethanopterin S-methyltransferase subunit G